jgi:hypothetical protein
VFANGKIKILTHEKRNGQCSYSAETVPYVVTFDASLMEDRTRIGKSADVMTFASEIAAPRPPRFAG